MKTTPTARGQHGSEVGGRFWFLEFWHGKLGDPTEEEAVGQTLNPK